MEDMRKDQLTDFHKALVNASFRSFIIKKLKKHFASDFPLIEMDMDELMQYSSFREIKARAGQKIIARKRIDQG